MVRTPGPAAAGRVTSSTSAAGPRSSRGAEQHTHVVPRERSLPCPSCRRPCRTLPPAAQGLYDPANEHDACGVAFVADIAGRVTHDTVEQGLTALRNLEHRGASGSEPETGDGAGILTQVPDAFLRAVLAERASSCPSAGRYAVGTAFLPQDRAPRPSAPARPSTRSPPRRACASLAWRELPVDPDGAGIGRTARSVMPSFCAGRARLRRGLRADLTPYALERRAYVTRKRAEHETGTYFPSLSTRTLVYKGMLTTDQLQPFFPDLSDERFASALALVHSRFSTNTFPSWPLAHPYRYIAHNGEINTVARQPQLDARPRGAAARPARAARRPDRGCSRSARPAPPTARASTRCSSCCTWAAGRCRTRC